MKIRVLRLGGGGRMAMEHGGEITILIFLPTWTYSGPSNSYSESDTLSPSRTELELHDGNGIVAEQGDRLCRITVTGRDNGVWIAPLSIAWAFLRSVHAFQK